MLHLVTQNKQMKQNQNINVFLASMAGILAGVTALALSDKDIRERVNKRAKELRTSVQNWSTEKLQKASTSNHNMEKEEDIPPRQEEKMQN